MKLSYGCDFELNGFPSKVTDYVNDYVLFIFKVCANKAI